jgi:hypothetical protein
MMGDNRVCMPHTIATVAGPGITGGATIKGVSVD